jgi:biopolymer transport protein TolR
MMEIRKSKNKASPLSEINVTPFVDVMLVLLVIFMVTAPLLDQGIQINLPKASGGQLQKDSDPVVLYIQSDQKLLINSYTIPLQSLNDRLAALYRNRKDKDIFIKADETLPYGFVSKVISKVKEAGVLKIGLVTVQPQKSDE